jgi:hypothetical protein
VGDGRVYRGSAAPPPWLLEHLCATDPVTFAGGYEAFATAPPFWPPDHIPVPMLFLLGVGEENGDFWAPC